MSGFARRVEILAELAAKPPTVGAAGAAVEAFAREKDRERDVPISDKVAHVRRAPQVRRHHCHWPGCEKQVPPAKWGCKEHWFKLPDDLRRAIWQAYRPGQESDQQPSAEYVEVARRVQAWILAHHPPPPVTARLL